MGNLILLPLQNQENTEIVDVEITRSLLTSSRGKNMGKEVLQTALEYLQRIKENNDGNNNIIEFIHDLDLRNPSNVKLSVAKGIGEIYTNVSNIGNYPSLSSNLKCGGRVSNFDGFIKINYFNSSHENLCPEHLVQDLQDLSRSLCKLGFDDSYPTQLNEAEKIEQEEIAVNHASIILNDKGLYTKAKITLFSHITEFMPEFKNKWLKKADTPAALEKFGADLNDESLDYHIACIMDKISEKGNSFAKKVVNISSNSRDAARDADIKDIQSQWSHFIHSELHSFNDDLQKECDIGCSGEL